MTPEFGEPRSLVGCAVADRTGSRFGEIEDVFVERGTDEPAFALISMGRFGSLGRRLTVVPLAGARPAEGDDDIVLAVDEDRVREAPEFSPEAQLSGEQEAEIEAFYGLEGAHTSDVSGDRQAGPAAGPGATPDTERQRTAQEPAEAESREAVGLTSQGGAGSPAESARSAQASAGAARGAAGDALTGGGETASSPATAGGEHERRSDRGSAADLQSEGWSAPEGGAADRERESKPEGGASHPDAGLPAADHRTTATNGDAPGRSGAHLPEPPAEGVLVSEEQLEVSHTQAVRERVRLVKEIVVEDVQITVPLRREVLRLERISVPDVPEDEGEVVDELTEEAFEVLLRTEEPVIGKRVVPVERVRVTKEVVTEDAEITEQLRKERVDVETIGDA